MSWTQIEPSPTAEATRFTLDERTSPTANTPGMLVSMRYGRRARGQRASASSSGGRSAPVLTKFFSSRTTHPRSQAVFGSAPVMTNRLRIGRVSGFDVTPPDPLEVVPALERVDPCPRVQIHVAAVFDALDQIAGHALRQV